MNPAVTMRQIAERAGVSLGTVSHVINNTAKVREKLRQRVLEAIHGLGYQPSQLARGLRRNQINMLVMIIPDVTNPFFSPSCAAQRTSLTRVPSASYCATRTMTLARRSLT